MPTDKTPIQWMHVHAPKATIRDLAGDGLEIQVRAVTVPSPGHGLFATADVLTVAEGVEKRHQNVLLTGDEARLMAGFLDNALRQPRGDRTASVFDDGMTLKIEGDGRGRWSLESRPVPLPPPTAGWDTFPVFSFELSAAAIQRAIAELELLSTFLSTTQSAESQP
jgi:hypothetical protein